MEIEELFNAIEEWGKKNRYKRPRKIRIHPDWHKFLVKYNHDKGLTHFHEDGNYTFAGIDLEKTSEVISFEVQ
jgi:hypothetical protein